MIPELEGPQASSGTECSGGPELSFRLTLPQRVTLHTLPQRVITHAECCAFSPQDSPFLSEEEMEAE